MRTLRQTAVARRRAAVARPGPVLRVLLRVEAAALSLWALLLVGVSGGLLWVLGLNYEGITGSAASKIHPATYLAVILIGWTLVRAGNPVIPVAGALNRRPASVLLAACAPRAPLQTTNTTPPFRALCRRRQNREPVPDDSALLGSNCLVHGG